MATNFTIDGRKLATLGDVQRVYLWEMFIPGVADIYPKFDVDDFIVRCRTADLPSRGNETIKSDFMSMSQYFMGRPTFETTMATELEEFEDGKVGEFLYYWRQLITNTEPDTNGIAKVGPVPSASGAPSKRNGLSKNIFIRQYTYAGALMPNQVQLINAWPSNVAAVTLNYTGSESIKYNTTWQFDRWELIKSGS